MSRKTENAKNKLPEYSGLDIGAFAALFHNTDASYKFLWMLSILDLAEKERGLLPSADLVARMLEIARPLIRRHRLRLGAKDRMHVFLDEQDASGGGLPDFITRDILSFAPYRLLMPFFSGRMKDLSVNARHRLARKLANERFSDDNPALYRFVGEHPRIDAVELHPEWREYIIRNAAVVRGWIMWHWSSFLQTRNPNRPNIGGQLETAAQRQTMRTQRDFWRRIIAWRGAKTVCIYSGAELNDGEFALDHYIPFNFVGHNRLWNLLPVLPSANSAKSDSLPHERYFNAFVEMQYDALILCRTKFPGGAAVGRNAVAEYETDLGVAITGDMTRSQLHTAYRALLSPLSDIAKSYGFAPDWEYRP